MQKRALAIRFLAISLLAACHSKAKAAGTPSSGGSTSGSGSEQPLTSENKIAAADAAGLIDHNHALLYYLYAATANPALPADYASDATTDQPLPELTQVLDEALQGLSAMPTDLQTAFAPFFSRPSTPGSAWSKGSAARDSSYAGYVDAAAAVRIWYPTSAEKTLATQIAAEIDASGVYATEKKIMSTTPCDDSANPENGGSGALDMYLLNFPSVYPHRLSPEAITSFHTPGEAALTFAMTVPERASDSCESTYVLLRVGELTSLYKSAVAHEMFHSFQHAIPGWLSRGSSWGWVDEATATWVEDQIYPVSDSEHEYLGTAELPNWNTNRTHQPACAQGRKEAGPLDCSSLVNNPAYSSYLFFFALTGSFGKDPQIVGSLYAKQKTTKSLDALRSLVSDFDNDWKQFALWNYNEGPKVHYTDHGQPFSAAQLSQSNNWHAISADSEPPHVTVDHADDLPLALGPTRIGYYELPIDDGTTPTAFVKQLHLDLSDLQSKSGLHLQAIIDIGHPSDATYQRVYEDWTTTADRHFCRDNPDEFVTKIELIADNANVGGDPITGAVHAEAKAGCGTFQGTLTETQVENGTYTDSYLPGALGHMTASLTATSKWTITFQNRDADTNDAIYSIRAENTFIGNYSANFDAKNSDGTYERHDSASSSVSQVVTNPAGPGDPTTVNSGYPPSDLGTIDIDASGHYDIYFISGDAFVTSSSHVTSINTHKDLYNAGNPAPAGSGCGTDEVITEVDTYDSGSNVLDHTEYFCSEINAHTASDPSELRPAVGELGSNIDLFHGMLDGAGEIHGQVSIPTSSCGGTGIGGVPSGDGTCTGTRTVQLSVKLPAASR